MAGCAEHGGAEQRQRDHERNEHAHVSCLPSSSGSSLPDRFQISITSARIRADATTLTTTSVNVSACTTGSTAPTFVGTPLVKIGAFFPVRYPIASSSTYVDDCMTPRQTTRWTRCLLVTMP